VIAPTVKEAQKRPLNKGGDSEDDVSGVFPFHSSDSEDDENIVTPKKKTTGMEKGSASDEDMFAESESETDELPPQQKVVNNYWLPKLHIKFFLYSTEEIAFRNVERIKTPKNSGKII